MNTSSHANHFKLNPYEQKIVRLAALGGMLEFYDFIIYGIFSVYFAQQFFPSGNPLLAIIKSYVVFILGYIARPIGGLFFSHLGDEHGRKHVLIITIILMGMASLGIGLLPTYEQIGLAAPLLLLLFRLLQGLALGGELPSTYVYISESMPAKRGSGFGLTMFGVNSGLLLGMVINQLLNILLTPEQLIAYGWRFPFIFGGLLCVISYRIRKTLQETQAFHQIQDKPKFPLLYLLKYHFSKVLIGTALTAVMSGMVVVVIVFMPTYLNEMLQMNHTQIGQYMPIVMIFNVIAIYYMGKIANHVQAHTIFKRLLTACALLIPCSYWLINHTEATLIGLIILSILEGIAAMIVPLMICQLFPTPVRLTGVAFCYNIGFTLFGGLAPVLISTLINMGYSVYLTPVCYLLIIVAIGSLGLKCIWPKPLFSPGSLA